MELTVEEVCALAPVIPVVVIDDVDDAVPLADALVRGGLPAIEVTLRTDAALAVIERIADEVAVELATVEGGEEVALVVEDARERHARAAQAHPRAHPADGPRAPGRAGDRRSHERRIGQGPGRAALHA